MYVFMYVAVTPEVTSLTPSEELCITQPKAVTPEVSPVTPYENVNKAGVPEVSVDKPCDNVFQDTSLSIAEVQVHSEVLVSDCYAPRKHKKVKYSKKGFFVNS